jgi:glutathione-regulated potassium-efflux system ancillary protein KefC
MNEHQLMLNAIIYLVATVIMVPIAKRLGLGSVLGYLAGGAVIGPWGLGLIDHVDDIRHFAEFGVILLLFIIGLELNPKRLWTMRKPILGIGGSQVIVTTILLGLIFLGFNYSFNAALVVAMGLSLSSTAIALQSLKEKNLLSTHAGSSAFSVLLFQDIAVIPMLALLPLLGVGAEESVPWWGIINAIAVIAAIILGGHFFTRPIFRYIAKTHLREVFTAFALLLVLGIALLMDMVGMSMALGAFLAGVLLADSEYRHELEVEIEPFKGLLMGLFFMSVGMSIDFGLLWAEPLTLLGLLLVLVLAKSLILWFLAGFDKIPASQRSLFVFLLAQGGEFGFVLFGVASSNGALDSNIADRLVVVVALSMITTPLFLLIYEYLIAPRYSDLNPQRAPDAIEERGNPVIIVGFGRFGRTIGRLLHANGISTTILDHDPEQIETVRRFDYKVYYGDGTRQDILEAAGAEQAKLLIIAINDADMVLQVVDQARKHFPHLTILARAQDNNYAYALLQRGVSLFQRELYESALALGEQALRQLGYGAYRAKHAANIFNNYDQALLQKLYRAEASEIRRSLSMKAQEELEKMLTADAEEEAKRSRHGWD